MMMNILHEITPTLILASKSPRRKALLSSLGFEVKIHVQETDESIPENIAVNEIPVFLAEKKAASVNSEDLNEHDVLIAADTLVFLDDKILEKPQNREDAFGMLFALSGRKHHVITGVVLKTKRYKVSFSDTTIVCFKTLTNSEIDYYIDNYKPFDKAGSYGIQEWIGLIGVEHIEGSYFNVMGLPTHKVYSELIKLLDVLKKDKIS